jgi:regulator of sigma E protease
MTYALAILAIGFLIIVHEAGHYFVARWCGMRVERFSIGFGPGIIKRKSKKTGTTFQIAPIPFGGFVEIRGMNIAEEIDPDDKTAYPNRPAWQRFVTIFAGPATNYLSAIVLCFIFIMARGVPTGYWAVDEVQDGSAAHGKLEPGDRIVSVDGQPVWREGPRGEEVGVSERVNAARGKPVVVRVRRAGTDVDVTLTPTGTTSFLAVPIPDTTVYRLGIGLIGERRDAGVGESAVAAVKFPVEMTGKLLGGLKRVITGEEELRPQGPVGIAEEFRKAFDEGFLYGIYMLMILSVWVGLFNLLPLPALDGGRLLFLTYELVTRRRANPRVETTIHMVGILVLLVLMVLITFGDIRGCVTNPG